ncbi:MAG: class I SAM-dependent DNA methyltransferase [Candidatus Promineifilaceae bacterium]
MTPEQFIERWKASGAAERANFPPFISDLCQLLNVDPPDPQTPFESENAYVFEKSVPLPTGTTGRIDLYKRSCFVLEAKQGSDKIEKSADALSAAAVARVKKRKRGTAVRGTGSWDTALEKAKRQAQNYARNLPPAELADGGRPPFLIIVDVGHTIDLYAEFTRSGGHYAPFPDATSYRLTLEDLLDPDVRTLLRQVWTEPQSLDPARRSARVTRVIADSLAKLAKSLEGQHDAELVANFLMRLLFTMFAEDVGLLPADSFAQLLADMRNAPSQFQPMMEQLWATMNTGGFSMILRTQIPHFNGGLFENVDALPLNRDQIELLAEAAAADWRDVEPAIFGTLLERALNPIERHKLGAHYTPRAYVERLVEPTVMEPLRAQWEAVQTAALLLADDEKQDKALKEIDAYLQQLAATRILDPACGSGNFLYVTLAKMKELEAEVLDVRRKLGGTQMAFDIESVRVTPQQFLGIEVNPRAAAIAELVLWIGYLQWHLRTYGNTNVPDPVLKAHHNIECRDAVLAWDAVEPLLDDKGQPVTRWDGRTMKTHPVTGKDVPDETARTPAYRYINPRPAKWPSAEYIVGNPPFIGDKAMREALGNEYVNALRKAFRKQIASSSDFVMYWWELAATLTRKSKQKQPFRFGFISTNSIRQVLNRRILQKHLNSKPALSIIFAIPDHPWVDGANGANVRISMTVGRVGSTLIGKWQKVARETKTESEEPFIELAESQGLIFANLQTGVDVTVAARLQANKNIATTGVQLSGTGFRLTREDVLKLGYSLEELPQVLRRYAIGRDLMQAPLERYVIDFYGHNLEKALQSHPSLLQIVIDKVKPQRVKSAKSGNPDVVKYAEEWWLFAKTRSTFRPALDPIKRFIGTCRTAKHRTFTFLDRSYLPDAKVVAIALDDAYYLGILSSKIHVLWSLRTGAWLGVGNDSNYNHSDCFNKFAFPSQDNHKVQVRKMAEQLDAHRKRQQVEHPKLTLTGMYDVLAKLRAEEPLTAKEQVIHEQGLVSILRQLHDDLDAAVFDAYGWPHDLSDEQILEKLVALNAERAAEEANGLIRWLRPEYQAPDQAPVQQTLVDVSAKTKKVVVSAEPQAWPSTLAAQAQAVRSILATIGAPVSIGDVAAAFKGRATAKRKRSIEALLETLNVLGQAAVSAEGLYSAA